MDPGRKKGGGFTGGYPGPAICRRPSSTRDKWALASVKVLIFITGLSLGGTEKAAGHGAQTLRRRGHNHAVISLTDGPRRAELESRNIPVSLASQKAKELAAAGRSWLEQLALLPFYKQVQFCHY